MVDIHAARYYMTHRPFAMYGEHVLGYLFRAVVTGGNRRMKGLVEALVDRQVLQPPWTLPSNLDGLFKNLAPVFANPQEIALQHTCLPAHLPFVNTEMLDRLYANVYAGKKSPGLSGVLGLTGRAVSSKPEMALCTTCVKEETLCYGYPWWHREHTLAGIGYCPHHGRPLMAGCRQCRFSQMGSRMPRLPTMKCWCGKSHKTSHPAVKEADGQVLTRMARLGLQLLEGALAGRTPAEVGAYYHMCAQQAGFAAGTRIKSPQLAGQVLARYSPAVLMRLNASLDKGHSWLHASMGTRVASNMLGRNLLLLDLFGEGELPSQAQWELAHAHMEELAWHSGENRLRRCEAPTNHAISIAEDRRAIEDFIQANPGAKRTLVLRKLGRIAVRARERDAAWYDALMPSVKVGRKPLTVAQGDSYWRAFDERASAHVRQRRAELLSAAGGYPKAITKTVLLKGTARGNELSKLLLQRLPKTTAALAESVETTKNYKVRYARTILELAVNGDGAVMEAHRRTGLPLAEVDRLNMSMILATRA